MSMSPLDLSSLSANLFQFKGQALTSLFERGGASTDPFSGLVGNARASNRTGNPLFDVGALLGTGNDVSNKAAFGSMLDQFTASLRQELPTSTTPTGLDSSQPFSQPGQNMVTVLNRVELSFKAQFSELGEMKKSLVHGRDAAQKFGALAATSSNADVKLALDNFVQSYNAGVNRFAPEVAKGGILEGSWEAERARFVTDRDIDSIMNGAEIGLKKGGLAMLGIVTDPKTNLISVDQAQFDTALAKDKGNVVAALGAFATTFAASVDCLNATGHAQVRQMANLDRAVHWIDDNKAAVEKEFGPGKAATPNEAFAKAAANYDAMAHLVQRA